MNRFLAFVITLLLVSNIQADTFYRSIDENGNVHYGDTPLKNAADVEKIKGSPEPSAEDSQPFEMRRATSKFPITLYVAGSCGDGCNQARELLKKRGIPFAEKNVVTQEDLESFKKESGGNFVPAMHIGKNWVVGFMESTWTSALDTAGYPKNAPYIPKSAPTTDKPKN